MDVMEEMLSSVQYCWQFSTCLNSFVCRSRRWRSFTDSTSSCKTCKLIL